MIFSNNDRQSIAFFEEDREDGYYYTFDDSKSIIDEIEFSACDRHDTSDLIEHDWDLTTDDGVSFMLGGLRSPCFMACYSMDLKDKLGKRLRSFDGLFESEREKKLIILSSY